MASRKQLAVCGTHGCPELTIQSYCHHCRPARPSARQLGYNGRWERTRRAYLAQHPDCAHCDQPAVDLHHVDGLGPLGPRGHDPHNLLGLCRSCHSRVTALEHALGGGA